MKVLYRVSLSLEASNYCLCTQSNSAGFSFVNSGKKHARLHFERNLVKDVHHRSVASRNWLIIIIIIIITIIIYYNWVVTRWQWLFYM